MLKTVSRIRDRFMALRCSAGEPLRVLSEGKFSTSRELMARTAGNASPSDNWRDPRQFRHAWTRVVLKSSTGRARNRANLGMQNETSGGSAELEEDLCQRRSDGPIPTAIGNIG